MGRGRELVQVDITLKNYRCFPDTKPARISLRKGFTAFVGANNSGKSSLLKFFFEFRRLFEIFSTPNDNLLAALRDRVGFSHGPSIFDSEEMFCNANDRDLVVQFVFTDGFADGNTLPVPKRLDLTIPRGTNHCIAALHLTDGPLDTKGASINFQGTTLHLGAPKAELANLFLVFQALTKILYIGPFRNAINAGSKTDYFDIKVGQAFIQSWRYLKSGNTIKENEAIYRLTEDIRHIFEFKGLEINPTPDDQTLQVFIDGKSYKLPELGSGITQFILVLANAATKEPSFILIDEPELNLHPSLQLDFLTTLGSYAQEGVLFGTHSIGLARASADWVYTVRKGVDGEGDVAELEATPRLSEFLGELSFSGYRELGFDKILLVEGRTEIKTVQQFLRRYRQDHQIVLLPLGGDSLINGSSAAELEEIKRISANVSALIDSERSSPESPLPPNREAFVEICKKIGINCHVLERRAIENYFSDEAVKKIRGDMYRALEPYQALKEASPTWSKTENWRIAREMTLEELNSTDLGAFLNSLKSDPGFLSPRAHRT